MVQSPHVGVQLREVFSEMVGEHLGIDQLREGLVDQLGILFESVGQIMHEVMHHQAQVDAGVMANEPNLSPYPYIRFDFIMASMITLNSDSRFSTATLSLLPNSLGTFCFFSSREPDFMRSQVKRGYPLNTFSWYP